MTNGEKIQTILDIDRDCAEVSSKNGIITFSVPQDWWDAECRESKQNMFDYLTAVAKGMLEGEKIADADWIKAIKDIKADIEAVIDKIDYQLMDIDISACNIDHYNRSKKLVESILEIVNEHTKELMK